MSDDSLNVELLMKAIENENNDKLLKLNKNKIMKLKNDILQKLQQPNSKLKKFHNQLKDYIYIDNISDINYGSYIRWINLNKPNYIKLTNGAFICDIKVKEDSINILCKTRMNIFFELKLNENLIFQKLNNEEKILLSVMNYIS